MLYNLAHFVVSTFLRFFFKLKVQGLENVPAEGGLILCSNHASFLDPPVVGVAVKHRQLWFMARDTLFRNPFFGRLIKALHAFPVRRGAVDRSAWKQFEDLVNDGKAVIFFPEGTRSQDGQLQPAKAGAGMLIHRCPGAKVVPVRLFGTEKAFPKGGKLHFTAVSASFGPAIDFSEELKLPAEKETYEKIAAKVMRSIASLNEPKRGG